MDSVLSIRDVSIQIRNQQLLQNISFDIGEGEVVLLSGANGIGKSSLLKSILRLDNEGKTINGEIIVRGFGDILKLNSAEIQKFRSRIAYVQQRDEYAEMGNIQVKDIISESGQPSSGKMLSTSEVNDLIDEWIPRHHDNRRIFDAKSKPAKFSGGEHLKHAVQIDNSDSSHVRQSDELIQISADGLQLLQHFLQPVDDDDLLTQTACSHIVAHGHSGALCQFLDDLPVSGSHPGTEFNIFFHLDPPSRR